MKHLITRRTGAAVVSAAMVMALALPAFAGGSGKVTVGGSVPRWATAHNLQGRAAGLAESRLGV